MIRKHEHDRRDALISARTVQVLEVVFLRGTGCCEESPVRQVTMYFDPDGTMRAEHDDVLTLARLRGAS